MFKPFSTRVLSRSMRSCTLAVHKHNAGFTLLCLHCICIVYIFCAHVNGWHGQYTVAVCSRAERVSAARAELKWHGIIGGKYEHGLTLKWKHSQCCFCTTYHRWTAYALQTEYVWTCCNCLTCSSRNQACAVCRLYCATIAWLSNKNAVHQTFRWDKSIVTS